MAFLDSCKKYYGTRDLYALLKIEKKATMQEIKKAYYRLSLLVHPDRVPVEQKDEATEKFKILAKVYQTLNDEQKKQLYDDHGIIDDGDNNNEAGMQYWMNLWKKLFAQIAPEDIDKFQKDYQGSPQERMDIKKAYLNGKGCKKYILQHVPFMRKRNEPRIDAILQELIESGEVPQYETVPVPMKRKQFEKERAQLTRKAKEVAQQRCRPQREGDVSSLIKSTDGHDEDYVVDPDDSDEPPTKKRPVAKGRAKDAPPTKKRTAVKGKAKGKSVNAEEKNKN